ncbi:MAG TPA: amidase family protein [Vicinamibacterales bacterium]|nr:amidase family protein [Vicinamibacterales bacterium]
MRLSVFLIVLLALSAAPSLRSQDRPRPLRAFDVMEQSIEDLQKAMQDKQVTSLELVELYLARIEAYDQRGPSLNAVVAINPRARDEAAARDAERATRVRSPLHGVPVLVKDNYETVEMPTTAGSIALRSFHPKRDAFLVQRLKTAGAVILGKTAMHELAAGITTVGSSFGQTRNPYDLDRTPGGSSGGTGAAIAANFAAAGMGSDTCGSIRIPAANNNLVGLRGTQGLSSRTGIVPLSSSQDIGGPIARTIADLAIIFDATVAADRLDAQTLAVRGVADPAADADEEEDASGPRRPPTRPAYRRALQRDALEGARIGVVRSLFGSAPEDQEVTTIVNRALEAMTKAGAEVNDVVVPGLDDLLRDSSLIGSDFKFDLMEYLARSDHPPVRSLTDILNRGLYHAALETTFRTRNTPDTRETDATRRARIKQAALRQVTLAVIDEQRLDALVYPTLRRRPARIGDAQGGTNCSLSAHSGLPALSVPAGFTTDEVPIGLEFLGPAFAEAELLSLGYSLEHALSLRRAPFSTPALVAGKAPAPRTTRVAGLGVSLALSFDVTTSRLQYTATVDAKQKTRVGAIWLHSGTPDKPAAARHALLIARGGERPNAAGVVTLATSVRKDAQEGRLLIRFYPLGGGESVTVHLPEMRAWQ